MKLSPLTIYIVGLMLTLPIVLFGLFMHWIPNNAEAQMNQDVLDKINAEAGKMGQAKKRQADAIAKVHLAESEWQSIVAVRTPMKGLQNGGIDLAVNAYQLSVDTQKFRNSIQRAVNSQVHAGGVKVVNGPQIPGLEGDTPANQILANYFNYPALGFPVVIFDLGTVTVQGTYKQIFENVRSWARMPHYLAVADGLRLDGTSPNLTGTYTLSIVGFIRANKIAPPVRENASSSTAGGGFGGFGGPGGSPFGPGGPGGPGGRGRGPVGVAGAGG